jgi:hypothetical protein
MTYHPYGQTSSSQWLHNVTWLNFNMIQSGHKALDFNNYGYVTTDRAKQPVKPTLEGEARYENIWLDLSPSASRFKDFDTRQAGYWSMLAGGAGYTYGHNDVWQFYVPGFSPASWFGADTSWKTALNAAGSGQAGIMKRLFESRPWTRLVPAQDCEGPGLRCELHCRRRRRRFCDNLQLHRAKLYPESGSVWRQTAQRVVV